MLAHPDKGGSTADFIKINEAWSVITNKNKTPESEYFEFSMPNIINLSDLFKNAFHFDSTFFVQHGVPHVNNNCVQPGSGESEKQKVITLKITVQEYILGTIKKIKIPCTEYCNCKKNICKECIGFGYRNNLICEYCLGQCYTQNCEKCEFGVCNTLKKIIVNIPSCDISNIYVGNHKIILSLNEPGYFIKDSKLYTEFPITLKESLIGFNKIFKDPLNNEYPIENSKIIKENDGYLIKTNTYSIILVFKIIYPKSFSKDTINSLKTIL